MPLKLKLNDEGHVEVRNDKPVYIDDKDGKEVEFDADATVATIGRLNGEAKNHREAKEAAEAKLKPYEGLDPNKAKEAIEKLANIDEGKLIDAGKVEEVKQNAVKAAEAKFAPLVEEVTGLKKQLYAEKIGGNFSRSQFIKEKLVVPVDFIEARFGNHFSLDEKGNITAKGHDGNPIYSKSRPGEPANFEEALEILVDGYAAKDQILKGNGQSGSDKKPEEGGKPAQDKNQKKYTREQFNKLTPAAQAEVMEKGTAIITD